MIVVGGWWLGVCGVWWWCLSLGGYYLFFVGMQSMARHSETGETMVHVEGV
jgi:hypothetical protein